MARPVFCVGGRKGWRVWVEATQGCVRLIVEHWQNDTPNAKDPRAIIHAVKCPSLVACVTNASNSAYGERRVRQLS